MKRLLLSFLILFCYLNLNAQTLDPDLVDVDYTGAGDTAQYLDIYLPVDDSSPNPLVIYVHGGAWSKGTKGGAPRLLKDLVLDHNFVLVDINYRLSPNHTFPAQIHDLKAAIRYLRSEATALNIDTCRIGLVGKSAGGHLSLLSALSQDDPYLEGDLGHGEFNSQVQAVASISGLADFPNFDTLLPEYCPQSSTQDRPSSSVTKFLGCQISDCHPKALAASPISYINSDEPAVLLLHGKWDCVTPMVQSQILYDQLTEMENEAELIIYPNADHSGLPEEELVAELKSFLLENLESPVDCGFSTPTSTSGELFTETWQVFPNPVQDWIYIEGLSSIPGDNYELLLYDVTGKLLKRSNAAYPQYQLNISDQNSGMYILEFRNNNQRKLFKIIKS
ncbi:MAG: alpha/beta hydrolase fold domain-containing protein [Bacteroidetes bacterium]|nr:alpha/beta hydrolase fold domain-containing protein [Bacteroidota bacterium]